MNIEKHKVRLFEKMESRNVFSEVNILNHRRIAIRVKRKLYEGIVLYATKTLSMGVMDKKQLNAMETKYLRSIC